MSIASTLVNLDSQVGSFPADPQVSVGFVADTISVINEHASSIVHVSFDGVNEAGAINPGVIAGITFSQPVSTVFLYREAGAVTGVDARVIVEG
jgi:hypothetical protein